MMNNKLSVTQRKPGKLNRIDGLCLLLCLAVLVYFVVNQPVAFAVFGCTSLIFLSAWHLTRALPIVERWVKAKVRFWHIVTAIITVTAFCSLFAQPADAVFLSGLEQFFTELAAQAQSGGSGETVSPEVIKLIFNLIRGVFLLLVAAAALFAYNQAQQGNDWRPIVTQVGLAFAIVIAIDVVTFLFIGNGTGTAGG